jgi:hypothetical protein
MIELGQRSSRLDLRFPRARKLQRLRRLRGSVDRWWMKRERRWQSFNSSVIIAQKQSAPSVLSTSWDLSRRGLRFTRP